MECPGHVERHRADYCDVDVADVADADGENFDGDVRAEVGHVDGAYGDAGADDNSAGVDAGDG
eukprot:4596305-Pyramimonas_sp.AAC.1